VESDHFGEFWGEKVSPNARKPPGLSHNVRDSPSPPAALPHLRQGPYNRPSEEESQQQGRTGISILEIIQAASMHKFLKHTNDQSLYRERAFPIISMISKMNTISINAIEAVSNESGITIRVISTHRCEFRLTYDNWGKGIRLRRRSRGTKKHAAKLTAVVRAKTAAPDARIGHIGKHKVRRRNHLKLAKLYYKTDDKKPKAKEGPSEWVETDNEDLLFSQPKRKPRHARSKSVKIDKADMILGLKEVIREYEKLQLVRDVQTRHKKERQELSQMAKAEEETNAKIRKVECDNRVILTGKRLAQSALEAISSIEKRTEQKKREQLDREMAKDIANARCKVETMQIQAEMVNSSVVEALTEINARRVLLKDLNKKAKKRSAVAAKKHKAKYRARIKGETRAKNEEAAHESGSQNAKPSNERRREKRREGRKMKRNAAKEAGLLRKEIKWLEEKQRFDQVENKAKLNNVKCLVDELQHVNNKLTHHAADRTKEAGSLTGGNGPFDRHTFTTVNKHSRNALQMKMHAAGIDRIYCPPGRGMCFYLAIVEGLREGQIGVIERKRRALLCQKLIIDYTKEKMRGEAKKTALAMYGITYGNEAIIWEHMALIEGDHSNWHLPINEVLVANAADALNINIEITQVNACTEGMRVTTNRGDTARVGARTVRLFRDNEARHYYCIKRKNGESQLDDCQYRIHDGEEWKYGEKDAPEHGGERRMVLRIQEAVNGQDEEWLKQSITERKEQICVVTVLNGEMKQQDQIHGEVIALEEERKDDQSKSEIKEMGYGSVNEPISVEIQDLEYHPSKSLCKVLATNYKGEPTVKFANHIFEIKGPDGNLVAGQQLKEGVRIGVFTGTKMNRSQAMRVAPEMRKYIRQLKQGGREDYIDASPNVQPVAIGKYKIGHCGESMLAMTRVPRKDEITNVTQSVRMRNGEAYICIETTRQIERGEELTECYADTLKIWGAHNQHDCIGTRCRETKNQPRGYSGKDTNNVENKEDNDMQSRRGYNAKDPQSQRERGSRTQNGKRGGA
jgi:hypothetical protein